jgi:predicted nucleotidyltransferase
MRNECDDYRKIFLLKIWLEGGKVMSYALKKLMEKYVEEIRKIYGSHLRKVILYGSYARGDFHPDSDIDIMILLDITDLDLKEYNIKLSYMTFDFNLDHDLDIKPIAKNEEHFKKWLDNYPFYANINREGVVLYGAA